MDTAATPRALGLSTLVWLIALTTSAHAIDRLDPEEQVSDLLRAYPTLNEPSDDDPDDVETRRWAVLPQLGYGPETDLVVGLKLTDRDLFGSATTLDVAGTYALQGQESLSVTLATPSLFGANVPLVIHASYDRDPRRRFFGLGNNDQGPKPASSHEMQSLGGSLTVGWRLLEDLSVNLQAGAWTNDVRDGDRIDDLPPTPVRFPGLPGIDGGLLVPLSVSLVYNQRNDVTRPVQGWRVLGKATYSSRAWGSDFEFGQFLADIGYLQPFFDERLVLGAHAAGNLVVGPFENIPFWALPVLGGEDDLRGYFPYRFLGTSSVWANVEARGQIVSFDFFDLWKVRIDGVLFGDFGRVFIDDQNLQVEGPATGGLATSDALRMSWGGGVRIALSEAILARIDVGFSDEETGLVYLTFGHTF